MQMVEGQAGGVAGGRQRMKMEGTPATPPSSEKELSCNPPSEVWAWGRAAPGSSTFSGALELTGLSSQGFNIGPVGF